MVSETMQDGEDTKDLGNSSEELDNVSKIFAKKIHILCIFDIPKQRVTTLTRLFRICS